MTKAKETKKAVGLSKSEQARADKFREILNTQLNQTTQLIQTLDTEAKQLEEAAQDMDSFDASSNNSEMNRLKDIKTQHNKKVQGLKAALLRLDQNKFGICISCEDEIPEKRLISNPNTLRCVACQEEMEHNQKQYRTPGNRPQATAPTSDDSQD